MACIESHIDRQAPDFQANTLYFQQLINELQQRVQQVQQGGGEEAIARIAAAINC